MTDQQTQGFAWGPGLLLLSLVAAATLVVAGPPVGSSAVAAVFPPWWSAAQAASAAGAAGQIVAGGGVPFVIAIHSDQPGLAARARAQGAWLVLDRDLRDLCAHGDHA